jgi:hypothetical protein
MNIESVMEFLQTYAASKQDHFQVAAMYASPPSMSKKDDDSSDYAAEPGLTFDPLDKEDDDPAPSSIRRMG